MTKEKEKDWVVFLRFLTQGKIGEKEQCQGSKRHLCPRSLISRKGQKKKEKGLRTK